MIQLYHAGGATDFSIGKDALSDDQRRVLFKNAARLLSARKQVRAAEFLRSLPFRVVEATNHFEDEFWMLHAVVSLDEYERRRLDMQDATECQAIRQVANVLSELGTFVRFISVELSLEQSACRNSLRTRLEAIRDQQACL